MWLKITTGETHASALPLGFALFFLALFTLTASLKKISALWASLQSSQVLPVFRAICKSYTQRTHPAVDVGTLLEPVPNWSLPGFACG